MEADTELFDRWVAGDRTAGGRLISRHFQTLHKFFRTKVGGELEDLIQRTFLACVEAKQRFRRDSTFRAFLLGLARIELLNHYRRMGRPGAKIDASVTAAHDLRTSASRLMVRHEEQRLLLEALRRIPIDLQIVVELSYWEKMTSRELGEVLEIPAPTVRSRLRRAKEELQVQIAEVAKNPEVGERLLTDIDRWASSLRRAAEKRRTAEDEDRSD